MKIVTLLYLEDDEPVVEKILRRTGVVAFSRLDVEGHGRGTPGWDGSVTPYRSNLIFALMDGNQARELLDAVRTAKGVEDSAHPIHAFQVDIEEMAQSGLPPVPPAQA